VNSDGKLDYNKFPQGSKREGNLVRDESDKPYYADYWHTQLAELPCPKEAIRQADAYFEALPYNQRTPHRDKVRVEFLRGFFSGFVNPEGRIMGGTHDGNWHGFQAGQAYRQANPAQLKETMEGFGYTATESKGRWSVGFETSLFRPLGANRGQEWWLSGLNANTFDFAKGIKIPDDGISILIIGFLSPKGEYGHLGDYDHEFYATTVSIKKDG
jgi:hypothetical protein